MMPILVIRSLPECKQEAAGTSIRQCPCGGPQQQVPDLIIRGLRAIALPWTYRKENVPACRSAYPDQPHGQQFHPVHGPDASAAPSNSDDVLTRRIG
jgi:hypothetical protein